MYLVETINSDLTERVKEMENEQITAYINEYPLAIQVKLKQIRTLIHELVPDVTEKMSYGMPAFDYLGPIVYFACHKKHIGFYPTGSGIAHFEDKLVLFKHSKGAIQFPYDQDLPIELIKEIIQYRLAENERKRTEK